MSAEDIQAIQQLAACYADAISRGDVRAAVETYAPDGRLETPTAEPVVGWQAIEAVVAEKIAALELIFQSVHLGVIVVQGDGARARFPITEWSRRAADSEPFLLLGWYEDDVVRLASGWRFSQRRLIPRTVARSGFMDGPLLPTNGGRTP